MIHIMAIHMDKRGPKESLNRKETMVPEKQPRL